MAKIQDKNRYYFLLRQYVDFMFKSAYRRVEYYGKENIPQDGAIIYAPNHSNTLMDALAVLVIDKEAKVFVARADVFKHPIILKILTFLKMLPINRKRDGIANLAKNEEITDIVVDVLHDKIPFCILPEGTHRAKHSLLPLQKGIFRIALQAHDTFGHKMPVYIVPVGIEFGHYFRYRSSLLLQIGNPINVTQFVQEHSNMTVPEQINILKDDLTKRLKQIILYIPDDENYGATLELSQLYSKEQRKILNLKPKTILNNYILAKKTIEEVGVSLKSNPQDMQELLNKVNNFSGERHRFRIGMNSILKSHIRLSLIWKTGLLLLGFPYFVFTSIATAPVTLLSIWLCSKFKDKAFHNTLRYLISFLLLPVFLLIIGIVSGIICSWIWGIIFAILFLPSFFFLHEYLRLLRLLVSDIQWLTHRNLRRKYKEIIMSWEKIMYICKK
ncbi:MAG: 1-acyl-sn-glycerol-3-phosphate acyltransferase [Bacteroidales bacterium]|jgi:1-acyl-sn-glycerol-3-phosphate acyltransferase|nr:1-acyl-sn-glycerol-3-phosphate acyltransferase [Bacteroidales bacterium]